MDKAGIAVAEYWTHMPPKADFENRIKQIMRETRKRLERKKLFPKRQKQINYYYDFKDDGEDI